MYKYCEVGPRFPVCLLYRVRFKKGSDSFKAYNCLSAQCEDSTGMEHGVEIVPKITRKTFLCLSVD